MLCTPSSTLVAPRLSISSISLGPHQSGRVSNVVPILRTDAVSLAIASPAKDCHPMLGLFGPG